MTILVALILGIVQGLTEFLPVSSSGHLALFSSLFNVETDFLLVSILLHLATLLAVVFVFYKDIFYLLKHPFSKDAQKIYIATIPTILIVLLFKGLIDKFFTNASILPFCFMLTAVLLFVTYIIEKKTKNIKQKEIKKSSALAMGIAQGLAILPGISRSGSTICTGLLLGEDKTSTAKFSFLMSIPIIIASMIYEILFNGGGNALSEIGILPLIISFVSAFIVGIFSIKFMLKIVEKAKYYYFSIYLVVISILSFFVI